MRAVGLCLLAGLLFGCTTLPVREFPPAAPSSRAASPELFSHADWASFLARHVDQRGRLDYAAAATDRADLDRYISAVAARSPDTSPGAFPDREHRLAYWLNAYNAWVVQAVLAHYPIQSVRDVRPRLVHRLLPKGTGFFVLQRIHLGGERTSLYYLENQVVRRRFGDPRIHFALNCASGGCPRLPRVPFEAEGLDETLDRETRYFVSEERNVQVDLAARSVFLSSIFKWYTKDFEAPSKSAGQDSSSHPLLTYVERYAAPELSARLDACADCRIEWIPYDWSLNDHAHGRP